MNHLVAVHVMGAAKQLLRPRLDVLLRKADLRRIENTRQVVFHVLKHHEDILWDRSSVFCVAEKRATKITQGGVSH